MCHRWSLEFYNVWLSKNKEYSFLMQRDRKLWDLDGSRRWHLRCFHVWNTLGCFHFPLELLDHRISSILEYLYCDYLGLFWWTEWRIWSSNQVKWHRWFCRIVGQVWPHGFRTHWGCKIWEVCWRMCWGNSELILHTITLEESRQPKCDRGDEWLIGRIDIEVKQIPPPQLSHGFRNSNVWRLQVYTILWCAPDDDPESCWIRLWKREN